MLERVFPDPEGLVQFGIGKLERSQDTDAIGVDTRLQEQEAALGGLTLTFYAAGGSTGAAFSGSM